MSRYPGLLWLRGFLELGNGLALWRRRGSALACLWERVTYGRAGFPVGPPLSAHRFSVCDPVQGERFSGELTNLAQGITRCARSAAVRMSRTAGVAAGVQRDALESGESKPVHLYGGKSVLTVARSEPRATSGFGME